MAALEEEAVLGVSMSFKRTVRSGLWNHMRNWHYNYSLTLGKYKNTAQALSVPHYSTGNVLCDVRFCVRVHILQSWKT